MPPAPAFDIDRFVAAIEANYRQWNPPIITFIANRGATPFEVLVSTLLSLRTKDEVTGVAAGRLLDVARTPEAMIRLAPEQIERLICPVGFYPTKARALIQEKVKNALAKLKKFKPFELEIPGYYGNPLQA